MTASRSIAKIMVRHRVAADSRAETASSIGASRPVSRMPSAISRAVSAASVPRGTCKAGPTAIPARTTAGSSHASHPSAEGGRSGDDAEEAANFYISLLPDCRIETVQRNTVDGPGGKAGAIAVHRAARGRALGVGVPLDRCPASV